MAEEETHALSGDAPVPPPGEPIHLPDPSYLPVLVAFGTMLLLVGVVISWVIAGIGLAIVVVCVVRWISQTRREMAGLPLDISSQ